MARPVLIFAMVILAASTASAQLPQTRISSVFPAGAKVGTSIDFTLTAGTDLDEVDRLLFDHPGITAVLKGPNVFTVTVAADVPPGHHEVRAAGLFGLSNPRTFVVGTRDEMLEVEPNDTADMPMPLEFEKLINGRSDKETDVDCFKFTGKKDQRVLAVVEAQRIDSRFAASLELYAPGGRRIALAKSGVRRDAVLDASLPADGEYILKLHDSTFRGGAELFYRLVLSTGPHLDYIMPPAGAPGSTGKYTVFGRNLPGGQPAGVNTFGRPLEKIEVEIALPADPATLQSMWNIWPVEAGVDGASYSFPGPAGPSNPLFVPFSTGPVALEQEPNDEPAKSQKITVPGEFAGQFQAMGDVDYVQFDAKAGEVFVIEVFGERAGTTADPYLTLDQTTTDEKGIVETKRVEQIDDDDTNLAANVFDTRTDDPRYRLQAPANATYRLSVRDRYFETRGDPTLVYRLVVRREQPDFRLIAVPHLPPAAVEQGASTWSLDLRKGDNREVRILALRKDGFAGPIDLNVEGLPAGVTTKGGLIEAGATQGDLIISAAADAAEWIGHIRIIGKSKIGEAEVVREARAGTIVWNGAQNVPAVSRVARTIGLAVMKEEAPFQVTTDAVRLDVNQGRQLLIPVAVAKRLGFDADVTLTLNGVPPKGNIDVANKPIPKGKNEDFVRVFVKNNATLGTYPLYFKSQAQVAYRRNPFADDRAKAEQAAANTAATAAAEAAKTAAAALDAATKKLAADTEAQKAAVAAVPVAEKAMADAQAAVKPATEEQAKAAAAAAAPAAEAEAAGRVVAGAKQKVDEAVAAAAGVTAADQGAALVNVKAAETVLALAQKLANEANAKAKVVIDAKAVADKKLADATAAAAKATEALEAARKAIVDTDAAVKAATAAKTAAEAAAKEADEKSKAAAAAKVAADKKAEETAKASAPQNLNDIAPSTPIILNVRRAPANLTAAVPDNGALKKGAKIDVKVTVARVNGFAGPLTLTLPLPPGVAGISAAPVTVPADMTEAVVSIQAAGDATEGDLANMVIRAACEFEGAAEVDVPVAIKVTP